MGTRGQMKATKRTVLGWLTAGRVGALVGLFADDITRKNEQVRQGAFWRACRFLFMIAGLYIVGRVIWLALEGKQIPALVWMLCVVIAFFVVRGFRSRAARGGQGGSPK